MEFARMTKTIIAGHFIQKYHLDKNIVYLRDGTAPQCQSLTGFEGAVYPGGPVWHDGFDLQELLDVVVSPNDGEAETARRLD